MPNVTDEQKSFISNLYTNEEKTPKEIIEAFSEKYGFQPSARVINKWKYFAETTEKKEEKLKDDGDKGEEGDLEIETEDTRKVKDWLDFSSGEIPDDAFNRLAQNTGRSKSDLFNQLKRANELGYKQVNLENGELKK